MAVASDDSMSRRQSRPSRRAAATGVPDARAARELALRRVVAEVSANLELDAVLEDVLDFSQALFGAEVAGLWLLRPRRQPFELVAQRDLDQDLIDEVAGITDQDDVMGLRAIRRRQPIVLAEPAAAPGFGPLYARLGFRTINFVPLLFRDEPMGLLVLYHRTPYDWTPDELDLSISFANQMATAFANARLFASVREGAARLRAIQELSSRLSRIQDVEGIGDAIVSEADRLIAHDTIRVYRVDHAAGTCEPIAFHGEFAGIGPPTTEQLRVAVGQGLTGWVAANNHSIRLGDAEADPRGLQVGGARGAESMLLVPMSYESRVLGVIVLSKAGFDQFSEDDQRTLEIFAGYAAQAVVNAEAFEQVHRQQQELHHRLESQRRLLEVNERLLATLDPSGILEMIADSLKVVVSYDALTVYRVDRAKRTRRAVLARDRFADEILAHEGGMDQGVTGWVIAHGEALLANDVHLDPRSVQVPGTPEEPESMIVCPLFIGGEVIGTLNLARMGNDEAHFTRDELELVQLFAAQASVALRNAEAHGAVLTQAEHDALTGLLNHGAFQRELGELVERGDPFALLMLDLDAFKTYNDRHGHPQGDRLLARIAAAMTVGLREDDRVYRYGGDEFAILMPGVTPATVREVAERIRAAVIHETEAEGPLVTITAGAALFPADGPGKDELVTAADRALYLQKPHGGQRPGSDDPTRDPYLAAVDQMTLKLLERLEPHQLLREIVERAAGLVNVKSGFLYLLEESAGETELVCRVGTGMFDDLAGYRLPRDTGIGWMILRTGRPARIDDYSAFPNPPPGLDASAFGSICAVPLASDGRVQGYIGLASGDSGRPFTEREVEALSRYAQLASIALDNARLFERAQTEGRERAHAALHDTLTGLPNRTLLLGRLADQLDPPAPGPGDRRSTPRVALILLDLDRFKVVNESLGHAAGDLLLIEVGKRLMASARSTDVVARLGSDEFGVLLSPLRSVQEAERVASRIQATLAEPFDLDGQDLAVGASLGLAVGRASTSYAADLLKEAEIALHRAKVDPVRSLVRFDPEMRAQTLDRLTLEHDLRRAVDRGELRLHYQPLVDLASGNVVGVEALLRWQHPTRGLVPPLSFIPLAEETGLILPIGDWVLETACHQVRAWQRQFPAASNLVVSVNLSARQFAQSGLVERVAAILGDEGLAPEALELEITESVVMDQSEASIERLRALQELGVQLVLDDFGTGYSSLSYLRRLPLDTIKIDRSFVSGLGGPDAADLPIIQAVISLAHGLGIDVVAEGIETASQLACLRDLTCDRGQGYAFARPLSPDALEALLAAASGASVVLEVGPAA